jgi:hypothetical protein
VRALSRQTKALQYRQIARLQQDAHTHWLQLPYPL